MGFWWASGDLRSFLPSRSSPSGREREHSNNSSFKSTSHNKSPVWGRDGQKTRYEQMCLHWAEQFNRRQGTSVYCEGMRAYCASKQMWEGMQRPRARAEVCKVCTQERVQCSWGAHMVWLGGTQNSHVTDHPHQDLLGAEGAKSRTTQANHDIGLLWTSAQMTENKTGELSRNQRRTDY